MSCVARAALPRKAENQRRRIYQDFHSPELEDLCSFPPPLFAPPVHRTFLSLTLSGPLRHSYHLSSPPPPNKKTFLELDLLEPLSLSLVPPLLLFSLSSLSCILRDGLSPSLPCRLHLRRFCHLHRWNLDLQPVLPPASSRSRAMVHRHLF